MILAFLILIVGLVGQWLFGVMIATSISAMNWKVFVNKETDRGDEVRSVRDVNSPMAFSELAGLGFVLGIGLTAWSLFIWSYCGGLLGPLPSGLLTVLGYLAGVPLLIVRARKLRSSSISDPRQSELLRKERAICRTCQAAIGILFFWAIAQTLMTPQKFWDERAIFAIKAKVLWEDRSINSPTLLDPDFVQYHPRYPLLLPLAEQHIYALLGGVDDRLSKLLFPLLYFGLVLTTAGVLQRHMLSGRAWLGALVMATVPAMMPYEYGFVCGQADAPTACYHGLSVLYLWDGLMRQRIKRSNLDSMLIAGICGGLAAFTKDEGIAFLMVDGAILGLFALLKLDRILQSIVGCGLFAITTGAILVPWFGHRKSLPITTEMNYFGRMTVSLFVSRLETLSWSIPHLLRRMFLEWQEWGLQWWLLLAGFISRPLKSLSPPQILCLLDIAGGLAGLMVAGMFSPTQLEEHIGGSSHRFLMQISPVAVLFAMTQFFGDGEKPEGERPQIVQRDS